MAGGVSSSKEARRPNSTAREMMDEPRLGRARIFLNSARHPSPFPFSLHPPPLPRYTRTTMRPSFFPSVSHAHWTLKMSVFWWHNQDFTHQQVAISPPARGAIFASGLKALKSIKEGNYFGVESNNLVSRCARRGFATQLFALSSPRIISSETRGNENEKQKSRESYREQQYTFCRRDAC